MRKIILALLLSLSLLPGKPGFASSLPEITNNEIIFDFPESATFRATLTGSVEITSVILEYGNEQQTCGQVIAKAFPQFTPGNTVDVQWTWEMRQSGSMPPGTQFWWRWRISDANGQETLTGTETATWLDDVHDWQSMQSGEFVRLHWYDGNQTFISDLANAAYNGLLFNETRSGLKAEAPIDVYIYASTHDLQEAILYEPSWTGGQAFPDQNIVILGISANDLDWGRKAIVHELTHVLVGDLTFSCLGDVPTWLNEGLAMYSEGALDRASQQQLEEAIQNNSLFTIRSLSSGFSEDAEKALLSYSQSYSIAQFLIEAHGQEKMPSLLVALRDGITIDEALVQTYGFDTAGLESAWRQSIGASPHPVSPDGQPIALPTATFVPTIVPIGGASLPLQATPTPIPTSSFGEQPAEEPAQTAPPLWLTLTLLGLCCVFLLLIGVVILGFVVRRQNRQGTENVQ